MELAGRESENDMTVLYVDDDPDDRFFFEEAIEQLKIPCRLLMADSCMAMKTIIEDAHIDIIFLDINMPVIDGKQCLKEIKSNEKFKDIPVVAFTVSKSDRDIEEVYQLGAHYHIVKPYAHINFIATLKIIFALDWKKPQPKPAKDKFVINLAYT